MINLVLGEEVGKEFFQEDASVEKLTIAVKGLFEDLKLRETVSEKLKKAKFKLGNKGATERVSKSLSQYIREI